MSQQKLSRGLELIFILYALKSWIIVSVLLLILSALILSAYPLNSSSIGYVSSAINFAGATFAGITAARCKHKSQLFMGLVSSVALVIILLTIGFLVDSASISSDSIISVVSFTFAGCLMGSVVLSGLSENRSSGKKQFKRKGMTFGLHKNRK